MSGYKRKHDDDNQLPIPPRWLHCPRKGQIIQGKKKLLLWYEILID